MLVFDIETTGLCPEKDYITVVFCVDTVSDVRHTFAFGEARATRDHARLYQLRASLVELFDCAPCLAAFNGVRFDIRFIAQSLSVDATRVTHWILKCVDVFECLHVCTSGYVSLNRLAQCNRVATKTSNGKQAIRMAERGEWRALEDYCAHDVFITRDIYARDVVRTPTFPVRAYAPTSSCLASGSPRCAVVIDTVQ